MPMPPHDSDSLDILKQLIRNWAAGRPPQLERWGPAPPAETDHLELLRINDVARLFNVGRSTVYELIERRELPVVRIGRSVRVPKRAIGQWIEHQLATETESA